MFLNRVSPNFLHLLLVALLVTGHTATAHAKQKKAQPDLPNFHQVYPFLYRGGEPSPQGVRKLHAMGIRTVIDLRAVTKKSRAERALAESLGMKYVQLPMSSEPPTKYQVDTFLAHADRARAGGPPVFLHCQHGSDRTGSMMGIYRVTRDGWTYDQAYQEMRKYWFTPKFTKLSGAVRRYAATERGAQ
jgi:protein tyrosine/serine phosphatase